MFRTTFDRFARVDLIVVPTLPSSKAILIEDLPAFASLPLADAMAATADWPDDDQLGVALLVGPTNNLSAVRLRATDAKLLDLINQFIPESSATVYQDGAEVRLYYFNEHLTPLTLFDDHNELPYLEVLTTGDPIYLATQAMPPSLPNLVAMPTLSSLKVKALHKELAEAGYPVFESLESRGQTSALCSHYLEAESEITLRRLAVISAANVYRGVTTLLTAIRHLELETTAHIARLTKQNGEPPTRFTLDELRATLIRQLQSWCEFHGRGLLPLVLAGITPAVVASLNLPEDLFSFLEDDQAIRSWFNTELKKLGNDQSARIELLNELVQRLASNRTITPVSEHALCSYAATQADAGISSGPLLKRLKIVKKELRFMKTTSDVIDDICSRLRAITEHRSQAGTLFSWDGSYWAELPNSDLMDYILCWYSDYSCIAGASGTKFLREQVIQRFRKPLVTHNVPGANFRNGVVTATGKLIPHDPGMGKTYVLPVTYNPKMPNDLDTAAPMLAAFLKDCWGLDPDYAEKLQFLREAIGVTLFGAATKFQRAFLLQGVAQSGKSQLLTMLKAVFPPQMVASVLPESWATFADAQQLSHRLLNICGELPASRKIPASHFKDIIDGTPQMRKRSDAQFLEPTFTPVSAHWFASNHIPQSQDNTNGFFRRWAVLTFNRPVHPTKIVRNIGLQIARAEAAGIIAWAVQGYFQLQDRSDYTLPSSHHEFVLKMLVANFEILAPLLKMNWVSIHRHPALEAIRAEYGVEGPLPKELSQKLAQAGVPFTTLFALQKLFLCRHGSGRLGTGTDTYQLETELLELAQAQGLFIERGVLGARIWGLKDAVVGSDREGLQARAQAIAGELEEDALLWVAGDK